MKWRKVHAMPNLGKRLRELRKQQGLSLNQLANASGISASMISKIENGLRGTPKYETVVKLAEGLKLVPNSLLGIAGYNTEPDVIDPEDGLDGWGNDFKPLKKIRCDESGNVIEETVSYFFIDRHKDTDSFYTTVPDNAMRFDGLLRVDTALVKRCDTVDEGAIGLVLLKRAGENAMFRRIYVRDKLIILVPSNPDFEPTVVPVKDVCIIGQLKQIEKNY